MEVKLEDGRKFKLRNVTLDERDRLMDTLEYNYGEDGSIISLKVINATATEWFRTCLEKNSDKDISFNYNDKLELFGKLQNLFMQGEDKASK